LINLKLVIPGLKQPWALGLNRFAVSLPFALPMSVAFQLESTDTNKTLINLSASSVSLWQASARGCHRFVTEGATLSPDTTPLQNQLNCNEAENHALNSDPLRAITRRPLLF
jgi:hypothetical protein